MRQINYIIIPAHINKKWKAIVAFHLFFIYNPQ